MFKSRHILSSIAFQFITALLACCAAVSARAQSPQVFVSARGGADAGGCAITSPCRTVSYALTQLAPQGQALIIDSGDYDDSILIDKSVTIAAAPGVVAVFSPAIPNGTIFSTSGDPAICSRDGVCYTVVLRGLTFDGQGVTQDAVRPGGIRLTVEDCHFSRFRLGIYMNGAGTLNIKRSAFRDLEHGVRIAPVGSSKTVTAVVEDSHFDALKFAGVDADSNGNNTLRVSVYNSRFDHSGSWGIRSSTALGGGVQFNVEQCHIADTGTGVISVGVASVVRVSNSTIVNNTTGVSAALGGAMLSRGNNTIEGNNTNGLFTGMFLAK